MAQIPILRKNQNPTDKPRFFRPRVVVLYLIRTGVLEWITENQLAREIPEHEFRARHLASCILKDPWESPELPGLHFEPPNMEHNPDAALIRDFEAVSK